LHGGIQVRVGHGWYTGCGEQGQGEQGFFQNPTSNQVAYMIGQCGEKVKPLHAGVTKRGLRFSSTAASEGAWI
jgi:hypothetical protein